MVAAAVCSAIATVRVWKEEKCKGIVGEREIFELDVPWSLDMYREREKVDKGNEVKYIFDVDFVDN